MKQSMCPCLGCGSRNIGCHDKCDKYKSWKAEYDDLSRQIRKKREEQQAQRDCIRGSMIRMKTKRRKRDVYYESKFKNLCKMAYKSGTLTVEHTEDDVISVKGRYWELQVFDIKDVTNKVLAAMAEFIGQLPKRGQICIYQDGEDKQIMDMEAAPKLLLEEAAEPEDYAQPTHLTIHLKSTTARIYQTESGKAPILVPVLVHEMIDKKKCEDLEEYPGNPALHKSGDLIWSNDVMAFALQNIPVSLVGERDFLRLINGRDMAWDENDYIQGCLWSRNGQQLHRCNNLRSNINSNPIVYIEN